MMTDREKIIESLRYSDGQVFVFAGMSVKEQAEYIYEQIADIQMKLGITVQRHGRWVQGYPISCSVCGGAAATDYEDANRYEAWLSSYCPNCGAQMDLEE